MQSEILRELEYIMCVVGLPVVRYVYRLAQGKLPGCSSVGLERLSDKQEVFGSSNLPIPTRGSIGVAP